MHILGLDGMPRRIYTYASNMGWNFWNFVSTIGAFTIAAGTLIFIYNVRYTDRHGEPAPDDPWDARTLEWITPNPTPEYNYIETPVVTHLDDFWHKKYAEDEDGRLVKVADGAQFIQRRRAPGEHVHMPSPSYWPLVATFGMPIIGYGQIYRMWIISAAGVLILLSGLYAWGLEPGTEPPDPDEPEDDGHGGHELAAAPGETRELESAGVAAGSGGGSGSGGASGGGEPVMPGGEQVVGDTVEGDDV
jgi:cytochrome c oxidase subunit I